MQTYEAGSITVSEGSTSVIGYGTGFLNYVNPGDLLTVGAVTATIASIVDNHELLLTAPWPGPTQARADYAIAINRSTKLKKQLLSDIKALRSEKEISTIVYDGKNLEADSEARNNIMGKLLELQIKAELNIPVTPESLFWRDADNIIHTWTTVAEYKLWLQHLVVAIAERTSSLYVTAWQKKTEVVNTTTPENYNPKSGW